MADTKQAMPDFEKIALEMFQNCVLRGEDEEIWHDVAKGAAILKKHWLAFRSGPDRTPDTVEYWKSRATTAELKVLTFYEEIAKLRSGPDRTTPEEKLVIQPQLADVMKDLDYRGIHWDAELAEEGTGWEVAAEPEPQYFETLREALDFFVSLKEPQAGPDRGQQDAPDGWISCAERLPTKRGFYLVWPARGMKHAEVFYRNNYGDWVGPDAVYPKQTHWQPVPAEPAAKAAREGQAPKGDRIKVEREPGCKCEYAIWTNAKGCPLHDVSDPVQAVRVGQAPTGD